VSRATVEDELTLGIAGTALRRERCTARLLELSHRTEPARLIEVLARQRLIHLGIARLRELGAEVLTADMTGRIEQRLRSVRWKAVEQEMLTHSIAGTLEEHRIVSVPLKGAVLARRLFDDPGLRESEDVDLLVEAGRLEQAVAVVRERFGYDDPRDPRDRRGRPLLHYRLRHPQGLPTVELHWRVHWYEERSGPAMVARCVVDNGLRRLAPADELACLLLVYARDGFAGVRPLADLAAWWDRNGERLEAGGVEEFAREFPELAPALTVSAALVGALAGTPQSKLAVTGRPWSHRMRRAARLANWRLTGADEQIYADIALVDLLLTPGPQAWASLRRQVLLPFDVVADRLVEAESAPLSLLRAVALHVPRILARFVLALMATRGSRTRSLLRAPFGFAGLRRPGA